MGAVLYIEAPKPFVGGHLADPDSVIATHEPVSKTAGRSIVVFLGGGITGCWDWQTRAVTLLNLKYAAAQTAAKRPLRDLVILNPRRASFPMDDVNAAREQIAWEHENLHKADVHAFFFASTSQSEQPITLFEYGYWLGQPKSELVVGIEPGFLRRQDVEIQTVLERDDVVIHDTLDAVCDGVIKALVEW